MSDQTSIRTRSGSTVDLADPQPSDIRIHDIAYSLARIVRFNGHSPGWNVTQHSIWVSRMCPKLFALEGLLHDAAEAYVGDVTRPLKKMLGQSYKEIECRVESAIAARFGLSYPWPTSIKHLDEDVCQLELSYFWTPAPSIKLFQPADASMAESMFLAEFEKLFNARTGVLA